MGRAGVVPQAGHLRGVVGLTTVTLAWITGRLRIADRTGWLLLGSLAAADTYEVAWVSVQRWRGVPSHFNFATPLDSRLFLLGGAAIALTVTVIVALTLLAFTAMPATPAMALAIRAGLCILLVAQGVGGWMIQHRVGPAGHGATEKLTTFGAAGVMKVPHAVAMHAIQVLPCWPGCCRSPPWPSAGVWPWSGWARSALSPS